MSEYIQNYILLHLDILFARIVEVNSCKDSSNLQERVFYYEGFTVDSRDCGLLELHYIESIDITLTSIVQPELSG